MIPRALLQEELREDPGLCPLHLHPLSCQQEGLGWEDLLVSGHRTACPPRSDSKQSWEHWMSVELLIVL